MSKKKDIHTDEMEDSESSLPTTSKDNTEAWCDVCDDWKTFSDSGMCVTCDTFISVSDPAEPTTWDGLKADVWDRDTGSVWRKTDYTSYTNESLGGHSSSLWSGGSGFYGGYGGYGGSYWSGGGWSGTTYSSGEQDARKLLKHKRSLESLCAVVEPTIKQKITWKTGSGQYMTNLETHEICLDGKMLLDDEDKMDVMAGITIHEKLHLVHTPAFNRLATRVRDSVKSRFGPRGEHLYQTVSNMVEDEYIEKQLRDSCPGFVDYTDETKTHFFENAEKSLMEAEDRPGTDLLNTLLLFIRYPKAISKGQKDRWAGDLRIFAGALEKALKTREATFGAVNCLFKHLIERFEKMKDGFPPPPLPPSGGGTEPTPSPEGDDGEGEDGSGDKDGDGSDDEDGSGDKDGDGSDEESLDTPSDFLDWLAEKAGELAENEEARKSLAQQLAGFKEEEMADREQVTTYAPEKEIAESTATKMSSLEETDYDEDEMPREHRIDTGYGDDAAKITWQTVRDDADSRRIYGKVVKTYKPYINALKRRFQLYGNDRKVIIRNQRRGKLDKRVLHRIPTGSLDLFKVETVMQDKPLDVVILVDESGSMSGEKIRIARQACIILKEALEDNPKIDLWIFGHDADRGHEEGSTDLRIYTSPTIKDSPTACGSMEAHANNRDSYAIYNIGERVMSESSSPANKKLLIVLSDGQPCAEGYGGARAMDHVKKMVGRLEAQNWSVIELGVYGISERDMDKMFKNWIYIPDMEDVPNKITQILKRVLKV